MNLFGVGPLELGLILVVLVIFVGPERLPRMAADLARTIRELRKYTSSFAAEFNEVIKEFEQETAPERSEWKEISEGLGSLASGVTTELQGLKDAAAPEGPPALLAPQAATNGASNGTSAEPSANGASNGPGAPKSDTEPAETPKSEVPPAAQL